jgi:DNA-binding MarR family transcriptional regulator
VSSTRRFSRQHGKLPTLDRFFTYRLHMLHKLSDKASQALYQQQCGLGLSEARCLAAVGSLDAITVNRLAYEANLDKGQASRAAQSLVDQGLLSKVADAADARAVQLRLTAAGKRRWTQVMDAIDQRNREIFGCLSAAERAQLGELFDRLIAQALQHEQGDPDDGA